MDGWMDGCRDGCRDGWIDGWMAFTQTNKSPIIWIGPSLALSDVTGENALQYAFYYPHNHAAILSVIFRFSLVNFQTG